MGRFLTKPCNDAVLTMVPRTLTLVLPYIVEAINEKVMYIFGIVNIISIPIGK
jgi:hypothetical protein